MQDFRVFGVFYVYGYRLNKIMKDRNKRNQDIVSKKLFSFRSNLT